MTARVDLYSSYRNFTDNVLDACVRNRVEHVIIASSSEVYGEPARNPIRESDPTQGKTVYAVSKLAAEELTKGYSQLYPWLHYTIVRFFNTVGPRQTGRYGMVIPTFVRQGLSGQPITVHGDGRQTRSFCHVRDVVEALLRLVPEPRAVGEVFNVGNDQEISIMALAERVRTLTGGRSTIVTIPYDQAYESGFEDMPRRVPDLTKISALVGFAPRADLDDILAGVIDYFQKH